ncbi:MFS transporter [Actinoplanes couchii]|uniref:MFS transporter n=1 Tax=Actinoplanes couchii TaxID=403638 RepID=A0ABQ3XD77_9ACTN|nr:MFS transporter [Actinoplanes couchii]MDR6321363.1 MFS family permease [Actinoplanes couchii]GID56473.1 MFS transporter [Actinoplanes couchii]
MGSQPPISRPMRNLLAGFYTSLLGSQMTTVALAFAVLSSGHGAAGIGLVLAAARVPTIAFVLVAGVLADRLPRRTVMLITDAARGGSQAILAVWLFTGDVPLGVLMLFAAVDGLGNAFFRPALVGLVPSLTEKAGLQRANALLGFGRSFASLGGPALGGTLVALSSPATVLAIDAATYVISALFLFAVPRDVPAPRPRRAGLLTDLREGWIEFRSRRWVWSVVLQFGLVHLTTVPAYLVLGPQIAADHLGGAQSWGFILGSFGAGSVAGGLLMVRFTPRRPMVIATLGMLWFVPASIALALQAPLAVIVATGFLAGVGIGVFGTLWETVLQANVPTPVLSRVSAYDWFGSLVTLPLGFTLAGLLSGQVGTTVPLLLGAATMAVSCAAVLTVPEVRRLTVTPVAA